MGLYHRAVGDRFILLDIWFWDFLPNGAQFVSGQILQGVQIADYVFVIFLV